MSEHTCRTLTRGCYRCELHADEIWSWIETLVVTKRGVVHEADCSFVSGVTSSATKWIGLTYETDRACARCLFGELPDVLSVSRFRPATPSDPTTTEGA